MIYQSVILPIYNEQERLSMSLAHILDYLWHYTHWTFEVVCVLNGCTDKSEQIARQFYDRWQQIRIVSLPDAGKGAAVRRGMLEAKGRYRYMADVDLSTPITELPKFLSASSGGAGCVAGVRLIEEHSLVRQIAHAGFRALSGPLVRVRDPQCGFKMFSDECAEVVFRQVQTTGWAFDVEVLHLVDKGGFKLVEVEVPWKHDSRSKLRPVRDSIRMAQELFAIRRLYAV
jgi:dolichyl-phosphate beta-glucosyltransferase